MAGDKAPQAPQKDPLEDLAERRAAAQAKVDEHAKKRELEIERRKVVLLETQAKYEAELGPRGEAFEILDAGAEGLIVLKPLPSGLVLFKEFRAKVQKDELTLEAAQKYVLPSVVEPDRSHVLDILNRRPMLHDELVLLLHKLYGANEALERGKS